MGAIDSENVEAFNDALAREHDIDEYYERSSFIIRAIEQRRLTVIRQLAGAKPGDRVLEVGCGGGQVLGKFPECDLTGVDVSGLMLRKAERNLAGLSARLVKGQLGEVALPHEQFEVLICTEVLEHTIAPERVLAQMSRLTHSGSRVVITFPYDQLINALKKTITICRLDRLSVVGRIDWGGDDHHLHHWRIGQMRSLLRRHFALKAERHVPSRWLPIRCCFACAPLGTW